MKLVLFTLLSGLVFSSCANKKHTINDDPAKNSQAVIFAKGFSLKKSGLVREISVMNPWQHANEAKFTYLLCDTFAHSALVNEREWKIKTPVNKVICLSTTHIGFMQFLNKTENICGISGSSLIVNARIREEIAQKKVFDVGYDENLNYELMLAMKPDLVFAYGVSGSVTNMVRKMNELGIPVILVGEYLEEEALGKMEWIKVFAECFSMSTNVSERFDSAVHEYKLLTKLASSIEARPTVLLGLPWSGTWYISGGRSYIARMIKDAGGKYIWEDLDFNESRPLGIEMIYEKALTAEYWINPGNAGSKESILAEDQRFRKLPPVIQDKIFNNNNIVNTSGGNAFYESGVTEPQIILADLITILHPQLLPSHKMKYYKKLH